MTCFSSYLHITERAQSGDEQCGQKREIRRKGEHKVEKRRENESKRNE